MSQISRLRDAEISNGNLINADDIDAELNQLVSESNNQDTRLTNLESSNITLAGVKTFSSAPKTDQIDERSADTGVTVDGVLLKDGSLRLASVAGYTPSGNGEVGYDSTAHAVRVMVNGVSQTLIHDGNMGFSKGYVQGPSLLYSNASTVTLKAGLKARNSQNNGDIEVISDLAVSLTTSGVNGLDTGSEASGTWYYVYLIKNPSTGTVAGLLSTINEASSGSITLPSGYTQKRQLPVAVRNDASGNILPFRMLGGWMCPCIRYITNFADKAAAANETEILTAGTATTFTSVSAASFVPPISRFARFVAATTDAGRKLYIRPGGSSLANGQVLSTWSYDGTSAGGAERIFETELDASQTFEYKLSAAIGFDVSVMEYVVTEVS